MNYTYVPTNITFNGLQNVYTFHSVEYSFAILLQYLYQSLIKEHYNVFNLGFKKSIKVFIFYFSICLSTCCSSVVLFKKIKDGLFKTICAY